jgi:aryl-alcohol dehydrogenase-like predicted oxidoreductase
MTERATAAAAGTVAIGGDLTVNRLGFGAMRITGEGIWGDPPDRDEAKRVLRRAVELGVDFIDTADSYGPNVSEELIAEALYPYPDGLVIASKGGLYRERSGPGWPSDARPEHLREALEGSLNRLRLERIDLYQLHRPDPKVPYEESLGALAELKAQGKIRHIGISNVDEEHLRRARALTEIVSVQNRYNPFEPDSGGLIDACERDGLAFLPWAPLGQGDVGNEAVADIACRRGASAFQIVIAWLLARSAVMLPIPGTGSVAHLEENVTAASIRLSPAEFGLVARQRRKAT